MKIKGFFAKLKDFFPKLNVSEILLFSMPQNRWKKAWFRQLHFILCRVCIRCTCVRICRNRLINFLDLHPLVTLILIISHVTLKIAKNPASYIKYYVHERSPLQATLPLNPSFVQSMWREYCLSVLSGSWWASPVDPWIHGLHVH